MPRVPAVVFYAHQIRKEAFAPRAVSSNRCPAGGRRPAVEKAVSPALGTRPTEPLVGVAMPLRRGERHGNPTAREERGMRVPRCSCGITFRRLSSLHHKLAPAQVAKPLLAFATGGVRGEFNRGYVH